MKYIKPFKKILESENFNPDTEEIVPTDDTEHLLSTEENKKRLLKSIEELENGDVITFDPRK